MHPSCRESENAVEAPPRIHTRPTAPRPLCYAFTYVPHRWQCSIHRPRRRSPLDSTQTLQLPLCDRRSYGSSASCGLPVTVYIPQFPATHCMCLPTEGWPGRVDTVTPGYILRQFYSPADRQTVSHLSNSLAPRTQLSRSRSTRYH